VNEQNELCGGVESASGAGWRRAAILGAGLLLLAGIAMFVGRGASDRAPAGATESAASTPVARSRTAASGDSSGGTANLVPAGRVADQQAFPGAPVGIGAAMEQVHYAYRPHGGAWVGGHTTYEAALQPDGLLEVKPFHYPDAGEVIEGDRVGFAPSHVARGGEVIAAGAGEAQPNARGQLEILRGAVVEQLANGADGIEQSWRFARPPEGKGDLEVRLPIRTGHFTGETENGLHFTGGRLGFRYGHGIWIDGLGVETRVAARWEESAVVLRVPEAVIDGSVYPAVLDPMIGPELGMDEPILGMAALTQRNPAMAWDGGNHLVVWEDWRRGGFHIYGARVSAAGQVLDATGIAISGAAGGQSDAAVAWDGGNYLVVWREARGTDDDIYGARVSPGGDVLDAIAISTAVNHQEHPALAWDGTNYLVVWEDYRSGTEYDLYGARVSPAGVVLDAVAISTTTGNQWEPALAWDGTNYLVVWQEGGGTNTHISGARVSAAGVVLDQTAIATTTGGVPQGPTALAWDGTNYLVVWMNWRGYQYDIIGTRVSPAGVVLDGAGIAISTAPGDQVYPAVAWDGSNYLVAWIDERSGHYDIYGGRVSAAGAVLDGSGILISTTTTTTTPKEAQAHPALAWNGSNYLVAWKDGRWATSDIYGARVSPAGAVLDAPAFPVATAENDQSFPAVAWDGSNYLVVWSDLRSAANLDIYGARVSAAGVVLDASGIAISTAPGDESNPALAWNGTNYLVVWQDRRSGNSDDIYGARVTAAGEVLDAIAISTATSSQTNPRLAWNGTNYLVVWQDTRSGVSWDVYGARVSAAGEVLDPDGIAISTEANSQAHPALAWDGSNYLVVWHDTRRQTYHDIYGARVSAGGTVLDPAGIPISTVASQKWQPALAWDGSNYLVVWMDDQSGNYDLYGARVSAAGEVLDTGGIAISTAARDQGYPAVAWDGRHHLVVWHDSRSGTSWDIYGARVTPGGAVLDSDGFLVSGSPDNEQYAAAISVAPGRYLVVYDTYAPPPATSARRVHAREVLFVAPPLADAASATTPEDVPVTVALTATDADGDPLTFRIASQPAHGTVQLSQASAIYTPAPDWNGTDFFTFVANDGLVDSIPTTVAVTVQPVNDPPVAQAQSATVARDHSLALTLAATDVDGDALSFSVASPPSHGTLTGTGADLTYVPVIGYQGPDSFTFKANDGTADSSAATVSITVTPVNESVSGGCNCGTMGEAAPLGALLLVALGRGRRRRREERLGDAR
jgi:MYXO-CTERM domain-containing protein